MLHQQPRTPTHPKQQARQRQQIRHQPTPRKVFRPPVLPPPPPPAVPLNCQLDVQQGPFERSCTRLEYACVDQGRLILHDPRYRPRHNGPPVNLPKLRPTARQDSWYFPYKSRAEGDRQVNDMGVGLPPIHVRTASDREPRRYLANPAFSNCTVPIVYYQMNPFNFAHVLRDNAARMYSALSTTPWAPHARLVLMTGEGLPVSGTSLALWQPLSKMRVASWAEFSVRLPDEQVGPGAPPAAAPSELPPSFEGSEQRCFRNMFVCLDDLQLAHAEVQLQPYGAAVARHYGGMQLVRAVPEVGPPTSAAASQLLSGIQPQQQQRPSQAQVRLPPLVSVIRQLGMGAPHPPRTAQLRVVFTKRSSRDRQLLNSAELLARCNAWRYTAPSGTHVRALCWEVETPNLRSGIASALQADVLVGPHGANLANAYFMRPGSSVIELTMHGFEAYGTSPAHANFPKKSIGTGGFELQWWKLLLCSESSWAPGLHEAKALKAGKQPRADAPKWRDLIVRWEALETALQAAVDTGGDTGEYVRRFHEGRWWWLSGDNATIPAGPDISQTCDKARRQGIIR